MPFKLPEPSRPLFDEDAFYYSLCFVLVVVMAVLVITNTPFPSKGYGWTYRVEDVIISP